MIDWNEIPAPYNYITTDEDGTLRAHSDEPKKFSFGWRAIVATYPSLIIGKANPNGWKNSLQKRPKQ